jgi:hypothetical protein
MLSSNANGSQFFGLLLDETVERLLHHVAHLPAVFVLRLVCLGELKLFRTDLQKYQMIASFFCASAVR